MKMLLFSYVLVTLLWQMAVPAYSLPFPVNKCLIVDSTTRAKANIAFQTRDWTHAATLYQTITGEEQNNKMAWFRLGVALHELRQFQQAVEPLQRAIDAGFQVTTATHRLARVYAMMNQKEKALTMLERSINLGFAVTRHGLELESELTLLRSEPQYTVLVEKAERNVSAYCDAIPEYRQFDFWLGEWDVRPLLTPDVAPIARSIIERANGNCTIVENYYTKNSYTGKSFNIYDVASRQWRQFWNDNTGTVIEFVGVYDPKERAMKYRSESINANGQKTLGRMTFYQRDDGSVRQLWESSTDAGTTWAVLFDGLYTRKR